MNQRGQAVHGVGHYSLDRWIAYIGSFNGTLTTVIDTNGTKFTSSDGTNVGIGQKFVDKNYYAGKYTCQAKTSSGTFIEGYTELIDDEKHEYACYFWFDSGITLVWAALYEGEYTTETLPEYQPKGYEQELLICRQYDPNNGEYIGLRKFGYAHNLLDNSDFRNPVNQRGQTSYNASGYAIDRWRMSTWSGNPVTITADGLVIGGDTDFLQYIEDAGMTGKIYTVVAKCNGEIVCGSGIMPTSVGSVNYVVDRNEYNLRLSRFENGCCGVDIFSTPDHSNTFEWVALYEGEYTAETLPEYQPKGYGVELAECQRYCVLIPHTVEGFIIGYGLASTDTTAYITVDLPVTLQDYTNINPTIMGTFQMRGNGDIFDGASVTCFSYNGHKLVIECRVSSGLASMQFYALRALENVLISKEL